MMRLLYVLILFLGIIYAADAQPGADRETIRKTLNTAKAAFEDEMIKYRESVEAYFDSRDLAARNEGNKKLVAQIKLEQQAYDTSGDLPKDGTATVRKSASDAQRKLEAAYQAGAKDYFKARLDKEADGAEKELMVILLKAKRATYVVDLKPIQMTSITGVGSGRSPRFIKDTNFDQAMIMHPGIKKFSDGVYKLNQGYALFHGKVAVARPDGVKQKGPDTAATFEILGDGKLLWKSKPAAIFDDIQDYSVNISGVDVLSLRVSCPGSNNHCHAHWLDPVLIR